MSRVAIELAGLEVHGFHGATEEERREGQRFLFDVELTVDARAAETDDLEDTVDYRDVVGAVRAVSDARVYTLLEALGAATAETLLARFPVERVRVRVRKPDVRLDAPVEHSAVTIERSR
jgi:dihydroneopterin aldolase